MPQVEREMLIQRAENHIDYRAEQEADRGS
ncbi:hypothetical protein QBC99_005309 [Beijerinckia sp. GAS462]|nr:hypothetical protein [Beijerinckia sp. GAS462]SED92103.1 hypothetical protein SAMN05443249_5917 [Beijerinckia sp. 28-YEA-48]